MRDIRSNIKLFLILIGAVGFALVEYPFGTMAGDQAALQPTRPGLTVQITSVAVPADRKPVVTFRITDSVGLPLDRNGLLTVGRVTMSFVVARIDAGKTQYTNYLTRTATGAVSGTVQQPTSDSLGTFAELGDGKYTYIFTTALPENYDPNVTHTVGIYASRDLNEFDGRVYVGNAIFSFVPAGGPVKTVREVVKTDACNQCHNPLAAHGGRRRETGLCVLCHQPQNVDPDTGNTVDFKVLVHKIHMGENLPSVKAGVPYRIIGVNQRIFDFSTVAFPPSLGSSVNNLLNCTRCHTGSQGDNWMTKPSRAACGSCHDDINWETGKNHAGDLAQTSDSTCTRCHPSTSDQEFDLSVAGSHAIAAKSRQLLGVKFDVLNVTKTSPGQNPTVVFNVKDKNGKSIVPSTMDMLRLTISGPTTDFAQFWQEDAKGATGPDAAGNFTYTFTKGIPSDGRGTYAVGIEGYKNVDVKKDEEHKVTVRDAGFNVVKYVAVTDPAPVERRKAVDLKNCNSCHDQLAMHGTVRRNTEYCVLCHNPNQTDAARRPQDKMPAETVHFKVLVHKIHRGEELENEFTVYGFGGTAINFNEVRFPGDVKDCNKCHLQGTNLLPLPSGLLSTIDPRGLLRGLPDPTLPYTAACTACHDGAAATAHCATMTAGGSREACATCHGEGKDFAVSKMHAKLAGALQ